MSQTPSVIRRKPEFFLQKNDIISVGGCITHDSCKYINRFDVHHTDHLWRRPTICLMSRAPSKMPYVDSDFPPELIRYWQDDFKKNHINEIVENKSNILVFDITRDIFCRVMEIEYLSYVIDPMSIQGVLWSNDNVNDSKVDSVLGKICKRLSFVDDEYFELWKFFFDLFANSVRSFDKIILNRMYFVDRIASEQDGQFGDPIYVNNVNNFLDNAYYYIKSKHSHIAINTIPRSLFLTGTKVSWGGPTYTHVIPEATSMFSENILKIILGQEHQSGDIYIKNSIIRAKQHEDTIRSYQTIAAELSSVAQE
ncbi:DUF6270 domain-containing protein, partial [Methylobacterium isbiliense]